jgi:hypothetical protein
MLTVPVEIKRSEIHGYGVFAACDIHEGAVVWMFDPIDRRWPAWTVENWEPRLKDYAKQRGYVNHKGELVLCIDEAQFLNFPRNGEKANLRLGGLQDGEYLLLADVDIPAGTELTVPPESDADCARKMENP